MATYKEFRYWASDLKGDGIVDGNGLNAPVVANFPLEPGDPADVFTRSTTYLGSDSDGGTFREISDGSLMYVSNTKRLDTGDEIPLSDEGDFDEPEPADGEIEGTGGDDVIRTDKISDGVSGGRPSDEDDEIAAKGGDDDIESGSGSDVIDAGSGNDVVRAGSGKDKIEGGKGADDLRGQDGNDDIKGENGNDKITGGGGEDKMTGGAGNDTFIFKNVNDSSGSNQDVIRDFERGDDLIDLKQIDAKTGKDGNQKFKFIEKDKFSETKGELRYSKSGDDLKVKGDVDGDGDSDFTIIVRDVSNLSADDFIL